MAWAKTGSLKGPKGDTGPRGTGWFYGNGAPTAAGTAGAIVGDLYLDMASGDVYALS